MADLTGNPYIVDTGDVEQVLRSAHTSIQAIVWSHYVGPEHNCRLLDGPEGRVIFDVNGSSDLGPIIFNVCLVTPGIYVDQLDSGELLIYIK